MTLWGSDEEERAVGPTAVRALLAAIAASPSALSFRWDERRAHVEGAAAWVTIPYRVAAVLVRRDGDWRLHTFCGAEPQRSGL